MKVLVTGGAGFLGTHLCRKLISIGHDVTCVDDLSTGTRPAKLPRLEFLYTDVSYAWLGAMNFDVVYHLASPASPVDYLREPIKTLRTGSQGTQSALEIARECHARFVLASTSEVYGDPLQHPQREDYWGNVNPVGPRSVYDEAKRYAEALTMAYHRTYRVNVGVVRIFNTYGPGMRADDGRMIPTFISQALAGEPITIHGTGEQTRSLCYVDDLIAGLIEMGRPTQITGPVNLGNPEEYAVGLMAHAIRNVVGSSSELVQVARPVDDPERRCPDISLAREKLEWEPTVSLEDGVRRTIDWFREREEQG
jgi:dTDP-glucose 4,6-dehydratase